MEAYDGLLIEGDGIALRHTNEKVLGLMCPKIGFRSKVLGVIKYDHNFLPVVQSKMSGNVYLMIRVYWWEDKKDYKPVLILK